MRQPNLFLVGAPRCGTTTLYHALAQHPEIYMSSNKEPWFYALEGTEIQPGAKFPIIGVRDQDTYDGLFAGARDEKYVGEASTLYLASEQASNRIAQAKDARVIMVLRNPVERAFSNFMQHVRDRRETTEDFQEALDEIPNRMASGWSPFYDYRQLSTYAADVARYQELFGNRLLVLLYDDLKADASGTVQKILNWLELDDSAIEVGHHNASGKRKRSSLAWKIIRSESRAKKIAKKFLPRRAQTRLWMALQRRSLQRVELKPETAKKLHQEMRGDILELEAHLGRSTGWLNS